jgi:citrate lyase subunit gamma (acyl carrier protein)
LNIQQGLIVVDDKGALDCVIRARMQAALLRGMAREDIVWETL